MLKLIGSIMVAGGTAAVGAKAVMGLNMRVRSLSALISALEIMRSEICYKLTAMPDLMKLLSIHAEAPARPLFGKCAEQLKNIEGRSFYGIWSDAVNKDRHLEINEQEKQILSDVGAVLGRYDIEGQSRAIGYASRRLEAQLNTAKAERERLGKVYGMMGVISGIVAVIIFL